MGLKIKYDSTKVDRSKDNGEPPKPGVYRMTIKEASHVPPKDGKDAYIQFIVRIKDGSSKGYGFWDRVSLGESSAWKLDQYIQAALSIDTSKKSKGSIDIADFLNADVMGRVKHDTYEGEYRPKLAAVLPYQSDEDEDDEDEDDEDDEDVEDEEDDGDDSEDDDESDDDSDDDDDSEDEDDDDDDDDEEEPAPVPVAKKAEPAPEPPAKKAKKLKYEDMEIEDLRDECKKRGISSKGTPAAVIARLRSSDDDPFAD